MTFKLHHLLLSVAIFGIAANANGNNWIDTVSLSYGVDTNADDADIYQLSMQNKWNRTWFNGGAWYVAGYWDAGLAYVRADADSGENSDLFDLSLVPVFRLQRDTNLSSGVSPFAEAGIGPHLLSETRLAEQRYSTALQLGTLIGFGIGFGERGQYELSYRYQYISNVDIKMPNNGMDHHLLRLGYNFY
ncbi:MAG: acyloxyacyl hydrolase [Pseudomonadota bacterium]